MIKMNKSGDIDRWETITLTCEEIISKINIQTDEWCVANKLGSYDPAEARDMNENLWEVIFNLHVSINDGDWDAPRICNYFEKLKQYGFEGLHDYVVSRYGDCIWLTLKPFPTSSIINFRFWKDDPTEAIDPLRLSAHMKV